MAEKVKNRPLTEILEKAGRRSTLVKDDGERRQARYRLLAEHVWNLATRGSTILPGGEVMEVSPREWIMIMQWLYNHIDGPPRAEVDLSTLGEKIGFKVYSGFDPDKV